MKRLIRVYPAWWRERHAAEMTRLLEDLEPMSWRRRLSTGLDLLRGAADAHLMGPPRQSGMHLLVRSALRRAALVALLVWVALTVEIVRSNVVHASTADDDGVSVLVSYLAVFGALATVGALAAQVVPDWRVVAAAGAAAGALIGALTILTYAVVDNVFLGVVSRQSAKIDGLAASGMDSMRMYINTSLLLGFCVLSGFLAIAGAGLAVAGGLTSRAYRRRSA